ncbi:hypothetical protein BCR32DRAFT_288553, partial [Anaeromyces robustus]
SPTTTKAPAAAAASKPAGCAKFCSECGNNLVKKINSVSECGTARAINNFFLFFYITKNENEIFILYS